MRALAEFIMSGRWQAAVIAFIGIPLISPASLGLVTLRRGAFDGAWIAAALIFPALLWLFMGVVWWAFLLSTLLSSVLMYAAAVVLRESRSWPLVLVVVAVVSTFGAYLIVWSVDLRADMMHMADYMQMTEIEKVDFEKAVDKLLEHNIAAPIIALSVGVGVILSLLIARWWQAQLYNPGGFREEFHGLRMDLRLVAVTVVLAVGLMQVPNAGGGILIVMLPLFFTGLGFVHWWAGQRKFAWLPWIVYLGMLLSLWVSTTLVTVGLMDSIFNLRNRVRENGE